MKVCDLIALGFLNDDDDDSKRGEGQTDNHFVLHPFKSENYALHPLTQISILWSLG